MEPKKENNRHSLAALVRTSRRWRPARDLTPATEEARHHEWLTRLRCALPPSPPLGASRRPRARRPRYLLAREGRRRSRCGRGFDRRGRGPAMEVFREGTMRVRLRVPARGDVRRPLGLHDGRGHLLRRGVRIVVCVRGRRYRTIGRVGDVAFEPLPDVIRRGRAWCRDGKWCGRGLLDRGLSMARGHVVGGCIVRRPVSQLRRVLRYGTS